MNVGGVPLGSHEHGFAIVVALVVCFTLLVGYIAVCARRG